MISDATFDTIWASFKSYRGKAAGSFFEDCASDGTPLGSVLKWSWISDGQTGGNCWGEDDYCAIDIQDEPRETLLEEILLTMVPHLTFKDWKTIQAAIPVERESHNEYNGNYTEYSTRKISASTLKSLLKTQGLLEDSGDVL